MKGSLSEKLILTINDTKLGMFLVGEDKTKPVLLFLGGGPGISEYLLEQLYPTGLEKEFVVCYLEYRGASLSYNSKLDKNTLTTEQYIDDIIKVTDYLSNRFGQEKIYLMGHSFGSYLGLKTASMYSEHYEAYIAMSQICNQHESECIAFDYMLAQYKEQNNAKKVKQFNKLNIRENQLQYQQYINSMLRDDSMHKLGVGTARDMHSVITDILFPSLRCTAFSPKERINIWRGKLFTKDSSVQQDAFSFEAGKEVAELNIPVYFIAGKYDYTCCYSLQKAYYEQIKAPMKGFYTFENSAHSPIFEEPERGLDILANDVKKGEVQMADKFE